MAKNIITLLISLLITFNSFAWQPTKPVTVIIGFQPGSGNEVGFRVISSVIPDVNFLIELKPGAESALASNAFIQAKSDGYTIMIPSYMGTFVTNDIWQKDIKTFQYNSFTNVMGLGKSPLAFIANKNSNVNSYHDLISLAQKTNNINFAVGGGAHKMALEYFKMNANVDKTKFNEVLYQGPLQATIGVASESGIEFGVVPLSVAMPLVQSGKIKILGITGNTKVEQLPHLELIKLSEKYINIYAAWALVLPPNTPQEIVQWYNKRFREALQASEVKLFFKNNYIFYDEQELDPIGFTKAIESIRNTWIPIGEKIK